MVLFVMVLFVMVLFVVVCGVHVVLASWVRAPPGGRGLMNTIAIVR
jgi:hypothetical protein